MAFFGEVNQEALDQLRALTMQSLEGKARSGELSRSDQHQIADISVHAVLEALQTVDRVSNGLPETQALLAVVLALASLERVCGNMLEKLTRDLLASMGAENG